MNDVVSIDSANIVTILCSAGDSATTADLLPIITKSTHPTNWLVMLSEPSVV
jgi:hypothetical protein